MAGDMKEGKALRRRAMASNNPELHRAANGLMEAAAK
jgi:hypothetical protein